MKTQLQQEAAGAGDWGEGCLPFRVALIWVAVTARAL